MVNIVKNLSIPLADLQCIVIYREWGTPYVVIICNYLQLLYEKQYTSTRQALEDGWIFLKLWNNKKVGKYNMFGFPSLKPDLELRLM